jgi:L-lysine exporter family protein LysE/ArgO
MHDWIYGVMLGLGAAVPIGPLNLEIIRRNLKLGARYGFALGLGACGADITYLFLLLIGALVVLTYPLVLKSIGVVGAFILLWFAYKAFTADPSESANSPVATIKKNKALWRHTFQGYLLTMMNPFTVLFWSSVAAQVGAMSINKSPHTLWIVGVGVLMGTIGWAATLNLIVHWYRHKLPDKVMHYLNYFGGVLLVGFAVYGLWHAWQIGGA